MFTKETALRIAEESPTFREILVESFLTNPDQIKNNIIQVVKDNLNNKIRGIKILRETFTEPQAKEAFLDFPNQVKYQVGTMSLKFAKELFEFVEKSYWQTREGMHHYHHNNQKPKTIMNEKEIKIYLAAIILTLGETGGSPSGHIYAVLMNKLNLDQYNLILEIGKKIGFIQESNHFLTLTEKGEGAAEKLSMVG